MNISKRLSSMVKHESASRSVRERDKDSKMDMHDDNPGDSDVEKATRHPDKPGAGAKKRKHLKGQKKVHAVMKEYKKGTLGSGGGGRVRSRKQAIAIAMSEAGLAKKKKKA